MAEIVVGWEGHRLGIEIYKSAIKSEDYEILIALAILLSHAVM